MNLKSIPLPSVPRKTHTRSSLDVLPRLADAYDASQGERGDPRRAMRWGALAAVATGEVVS